MRDRVAEGFELPVLALELLDERGARLGQLARGARLGGLELPVQQLLADAAVLVLELLAPHLGAHARAQHVEVARLGDVVVGAGAEPADHRRAVLERGQHDERGVARRRRGLDAPAGLLAADARHQQIQQDAIDRLHRQQLERLLARARQHDVVASPRSQAGDSLCR